MPSWLPVILTTDGHDCFYFLDYGKINLTY